VVRGGYAAHREAPQHHDPPRYELRDRPAGSVLAHLGEVQWADWAGGGELLTATTGGRLQIRDRVTLQVVWEHDLAQTGPDSGEPPAKAGTGSHPAELARMSSWSQFQSPPTGAPSAEPGAGARNQMIRFPILGSRLTLLVEEA